MLLTKKEKFLCRESMKRVRSFVRKTGEEKKSMKMLHSYNKIKLITYLVLHNDENSFNKQKDITLQQSRTKLTIQCSTKNNSVRVTVNKKSLFLFVLCDFNWIAVFQRFTCIQTDSLFQSEGFN